jgi:hypothetical protein
MWVVLIAAHFILPQLNVLGKSFNAQQVFENYGHIYVSVLAICAIQFWIGLRSRNFIVPIAIGIACWLAGTIMAMEYHAEASIYFPYSFHVIRLSHFTPKLTQVEWTSFGSCILIFVLGYWDFTRRRFAK